MLTTFASIRGHIKFNPSKPSIDNVVFKLHYRATFILLLVFTILVCSREYIGAHISCYHDSGGIEPHVIQTFCFFTSTFTLVRYLNETAVKSHLVPHPGVGPLSDNDHRRYHAYYQWVPFFLFGQALMFYATHYVWRKAEGGRLKALIDGLQMAKLSLRDTDMTTSNGQFVPSRLTLQHRLELIRKDIIARLKVTRTWSTYLVTCEILNFFNVILQICFTNKFLNGLFINLGPELLRGNWSTEIDPLDSVFPKVTKCEFFKYGPSGSMQKHDILCVMALNVINEKIFAILWFWYWFLLIASFLAVVWRVMTFYQRRSPKFNEYVFRTSSPGKIDPWNIITFSRGCHFADWLFLNYLAHNMDGFVFKELLARLAEELQKQEVSYEVGDDNKGEAVLIKNTPLYTTEDEMEPLKIGFKEKDT